jgi:hypothetical protein
MRKLFIKETDEVVENGDVVVVSFDKELEDGNVTFEKELKMEPATAVLLIELGILEERDVEDDLIDFDEEEDDYCEELANLYEEVGAIEARVTELEETWESWGEELKAALKELKAALKEKEESKAKTASPKKK